MRGRQQPVRYAGRKAAAFALSLGNTILNPNENQIEREKNHIYSFVQRRDGIRWRELIGGINRVMQDYCSDCKDEKILTVGLKLLEKIRTEEMSEAFAANPRELSRIIESEFLLTVGELVILSSMARKASSSYLNFFRLDYPQIDPPEWNKLITIHRGRNGVEIDELPLDYYLRSPYAPSYEENYRTYSGIKRGK